MRDLVSHVLEEIQVAPGLLLKVVRCTPRPAYGAGVLLPPVTAYCQVQLVRPRANVQALTRQFPRCLDTEPKEQNLIAVHRSSSCQLPRVNWHRPADEFHSKRRRTQFPRCLDTEPKEQNLIAVHRSSSCQLPRVNWHRPADEFHSKRQRTIEFLLPRVLAGLESGETLIEIR
jgi:hypothetical protein